MVRGHAAFSGGDVCSLLASSSAAWAWVVLFSLPVFPPWSSIQLILLPLQLPLLWLPPLPSRWSSLYLYSWALSLSPARALCPDSWAWRAADFVHTWAWVTWMMACCSALTCPGTIVCSVSPSRAAGIIWVWEALGLLLFFIKKNPYYV